MKTHTKPNNYCIEVCAQEQPDKDSEICQACLKQYQRKSNEQEKGEKYENEN